MNPARILLADDHAVVIEGLRRMLDSPRFEVVGVATDGRALLEAAARLRPDIIISDVAMPLLNGIDAARELRERDPHLKIIFLTMHSEVMFATAALAAGALGYVLKSAAGEELLSAIRHALQGRVYVSKAIAQSVKHAAEVMPKRGVVNGLTHRQREILQLLAEGRQIKEIATVLNLSPKTVEFHKYRIMDMLSVHTAADLTRYALKHGIIA